MQSFSAAWVLLYVLIVTKIKLKNIFQFREKKKIIRLRTINNFNDLPTYTTRSILKDEHILRLPIALIPIFANLKSILFYLSTRCLRFPGLHFKAVTKLNE